MSPDPDLPTAREVDLAIHDLGGSGPDLVMVHATGYCGQVWRPVADQLASDYRCLALDQRMHGESGRDDKPIEWLTLGVDGVEVVEGLGPGRRFGAGHSAGATLLLLTEAARPGTFDGIWCYEPVAFRPDPDADFTDDNPMAEAAAGRRSRFPGRAEALKHFRARPPFQNFDSQALAGFIEGGLVDRGEGLELACRPEDEARFYRMEGIDEAWYSIERIECPVTVATGTLPGSFGEAHAQSVADLVQLGQVEVMEGLSHFGPLEDPLRIAESIRDSLGS